MGGRGGCDSLVQTGEGRALEMPGQAAKQQPRDAREIPWLRVLAVEDPEGKGHDGGESDADPPRPLDLTIYCNFANISIMAKSTGMPQDTLRLTTLTQVHAWAHPTRMSLLGFMAAEPLNLTRAGRRLGVHPANLSRHFRVLERAGLIRLVERRDTGRNVEKYYRAVASNFVPEPQGLDAADKRLLALGVLRDELAAAMTRIRGSPEADLLVLMQAVRLRPADRARVYRKLQSLLKDVASRDSPAGSPCTMGLCLFPALHHPEGGEEIRL